MAAAASQRAAAAAKKQPAMTAAGVPHIYHDYSRVPDEANYVRKKTGGVSKYRSMYAGASLFLPVWLVFVAICLLACLFARF